MSLSAHKVYGPKGVGALLLRPGTSERRGAPDGAAIRRRTGARSARGHRADPPSGGHGSGIRAGARGSARGVRSHRRIARALWQGLASLGGAWRNGEAARSVPHILNVSFEGVEGESLLAALRGRLAVSTGSACTSALQEASYVLRALGRSEVLSESSLRFGLGRPTSEDDIDTAVAAVSEAVSALAPYRRRMNYSELTLRYFESAPGAGVLSGPDVHRGAAGSREQGTWVQFDLQVSVGEYPGGAVPGFRLPAYHRGVRMGCRACGWARREARPARERAGIERALRRAGGEARPAIDHRGRLDGRSERCIAAMTAARP